MFSKVRNKTAFKNDGGRQTNWEAKQELINRGIAAQWLDIEKHVAWHGGYVLDQVVARKGEGCWDLIVKASRGRRPLVAYVKADTLAEAFELAGEWADRGVFAWTHDKHPSKRLKRLLNLS